MPKSKVARPYTKPRPTRIPRVRCPYCHLDIQVDQGGWVACRSCLARAHEACWADLQACSCCRSHEVLHESRGRPRRAPRRRWPGGVALGVMLGVALAVTAVSVPWQLPRSWRPAALERLDGWVVERYRQESAQAAPIEHEPTAAPDYVLERLDFLEAEARASWVEALCAAKDAYPDCPHVDWRYRRALGR